MRKRERTGEREAEIEEEEKEKKREKRKKEQRSTKSENPFKKHERTRHDCFVISPFIVKAQAELLACC